MTQSLAGITDVEARLGRSLTADELNSIDGILSDISSLIRRYTGRNFTKTTVTKRFRPVNAEVRLPGKPISEIVDARYVDWYGQTDRKSVVEGKGVGVRGGHNVEKEISKKCT